jgi:hypothetical protein
VIGGFVRTTIVLLAALTGGISNQILLADQGASPALEWYDADGEPMSGTDRVLRTKPAETYFRTVTRPAQGSTQRKPTRTSDGRLATGVGYSAWFDGTRVHVTTMLLTPKDPTVKNPMRELGVADRDFFSPALLTRFSLAVGEARTLDELKKFGWPPITVRVHPPGFKH